MGGGRRSGLPTNHTPGRRRRRFLLADHHDGKPKWVVLDMDEDYRVVFESSSRRAARDEVARRNAQEAPGV